MRDIAKNNIFFSVNKVIMALPSVFILCLLIIASVQVQC